MVTPGPRPPSPSPLLVVEDEVLEIHQHHYILATSSRADDRTRVLKHGATFAVFDRFGDIQPVRLGEQGLYFDDTRFLSRLELRVGERRPHLLSSNVREHNDLLTVDLTNADLTRDDAVLLPRGELHLQRSKLLWADSCYERLVLSNFSRGPIETDLSVRFGADFVDIFEVRGELRPRRGTRLESVVEEASVELGYEGLDGRRRRTRLLFEPAPIHLAADLCRYHVRLDPGASFTIDLRATCEVDPTARPVVLTYEGAVGELRRRLSQLGGRGCSLVSSNEAVNDWLTRSRWDLQMMTVDTPHGPFPHAGVPWFSCPFGRDSLITALECLWVDPSLAAGVLRFLAATQATAFEPERDAQPGKILHEMRGGEMAALGEVPFGRYYGSVDATPLYLLLAGEYFRCSGDRELIDEIWPHIEAALHWIERYGDADGDGFVEYAARCPTGLLQQGWKDSGDSIFHADGHLARPPIALCEVQGYVHGAYSRIADVARARGDEALALRLHERARALREAFERAFWCEDIGTYALALDGDKRPCAVRTSNAGHVLLSDLPSRERARAVAAELMSPRAFSGWGVRTLGAGEARYNPMSYHNGSLWPHDNALVASGLGRHGFREEAVRTFESMLRASGHFELRRMPELFCGFSFREGEGPTQYPVACAPQAWAAAAPYMMLQACLGLEVDGRDGVVSFCYPELPASVAELRIEGLLVGSRGRVDLLLERHPHDVGVTVLRREGNVRVFVEKVR
jgi:glycogen debranching enzyme